MVNTPQNDLVNGKDKEQIVPISEEEIQKNQKIIQSIASGKETAKDEQQKEVDNLGKQLNGLPVKDVDSFYTGKVKLHEGKEYHILNTDKLVDFFGEENNANYGKKTMPTLIRKAIAGEKIQTFTKNAAGEYVPETEIVAKEGQYVFQNVNDSKDTFIPQDANIINEYDIGNNVVGNEFMPFIRKSKPSRLLVGIIKKPTVIVVKSRGNAEQYLDEGATLKLEESKDKKEVTGINAGGFEAWGLTDKEGNIKK